MVFDDINCAHDLGVHGKLHVTSHSAMHFEPLRIQCKQSSCDATHEIGSNGLSFIQPIQNIIQQKLHGEKMLFTKLPDGYIVHNPNGVVYSILKDEHLCKPLNEVHDGNNKILAYSLVAPPGQDNIIHFKFMKGCDTVLPPNCISNYTPVDHAIAKIAAAIPFTSEPRAIYTSPNLGTLSGFHCKGENAQSLKNIFMKLKQKTNVQNMYDTPLKLPENISKLLNLKNSEGNICIAPLQNGIIGYRNRKSDDGQTLIFLANSNDFHHDIPLNPEKSIVQVFKMDYNSNGSNARRIFVNTRGKPFQTAKCRYNTPSIVPNMSVQEALNCVDFSMRKSLMDHLNIGDYPSYCELMELMRKLQE
jgi:hypothetical protein